MHQKNKIKIPKGILLLTIPQHLFGACAAIYLIGSGEVKYSFLLLTYFMWICIGVVGVGIFYHKYWSHSSFHCSPYFAIVGTYLGCLAGLGSPIAWSLLHINHHHRYADRSPLDVHSPTLGLWQSYLGWHFYPFELLSSGFRARYKNKILRFFTKYYFRIYWGTAVLLFTFDTNLPTFALFLPGFLHFHMESIIACFCHQKRFGYRNFETNDESVNIKWLAWLSWGAAYHNNHHAQPNNWNCGVKPGEIDLSSFIIQWIRQDANTKTHTY